MTAPNAPIPTPSGDTCTRHAGFAAAFVPTRAKRGGRTAAGPARRSSGAAAHAGLAACRWHSFRLLTGGFAAAGGHGYHYRLLAALMEFGPASQATLGRHAGIDRSDVVAALNDLADRGFIERAADHADRRRNVVTITPAGVAAFHSLDAVVAGIQEAVLAPLSKAERAELVRLLTRLVEYHAQQ